MLTKTTLWKVVAKEVMNPDVMTVRDDMTVQEVAAFLIENQISGAPVEDGEGRLVGVVSYADIARAASDPDAARLMLDAHIHRLLVTQDHKVVGILTTFDLLKLLVDVP